MNRQSGGEANCLVVVEAVANERRICDDVFFWGEQLESFRYRVDDVKRAVTKIAIKEARLAEIKQEVR